MLPFAYYSENNAFCAQWIRNLIKAKLIPDGDVDDRSIVDVDPRDLHPYTQIHLFAGLAGWAGALRLAGIPDDFRVFSASLPCQPFSSAGAGAGFADERHLWPAVYKIIQEIRPERIIGEQVDSPIARVWLDALFDDLEGSDYACGSIVLPSASVGAPNIRHRRFWVAERDGCGFPGARWLANTSSPGRQQVGGSPPSNEAAHGRARRDQLESNSNHFTAGVCADLLPSGLGWPESVGSSTGSRNANAGHGADQSERSDHAGSRLADADGRDTGTERLQRGGQHGLFPAGGLLDDRTRGAERAIWSECARRVANPASDGHGEERPDSREFEPGEGAEGFAAGSVRCGDEFGGLGRADRLGDTQRGRLSHPAAPDARGQGRIQGEREAGGPGGACGAWGSAKWPAAGRNESRPLGPLEPSPSLRCAPLRGQHYAPLGPLRPWDCLVWIPCADGKQRPVAGKRTFESRLLNVVAGHPQGVDGPRAAGHESPQEEAVEIDIFPLAQRQPGDVDILRAAGNAINIPLAAEVIKAWLWWL